MEENRPYGSEGGKFQVNETSLPYLCEIECHWADAHCYRLSPLRGCFTKLSGDYQ